MLLRIVLGAWEELGRCSLLFCVRAVEVEMVRPLGGVIGWIR